MSYSDSFIPIARDSRNFILESLDDASRFGNQLNANFLAQRQIPEQLSRTSLNDLNNRFEIQNRQSTWDTDLERNKLESELGVRTNRYALDDFDSAREAERVLRDAQVKQAQFNLEFQDDERDLKVLELEQRRLAAEGEVEKRTFDRQYDQLIASIPGYAMLPPLERYTRLIDLADMQKVHPNVKARINSDFLENNSRDFQMFNMYVSISKQIESALNAGVDPNSPQLVELKRRANGLRTLGINQDVIMAAAKNGLISIGAATYLLDSAETASPAQDAVNAPVPGGSTPSNVDTGTPVETYQSPTDVQQPHVQQGQAEQPPVQQTQYEQPLITSPIVYQQIAQIDMRPETPPEYRGILFDRSFDQSNIDQKLQVLMDYALYASDMVSDPQTLDFIWNKIESVQNMKTVNGW